MAEDEVTPEGLFEAAKRDHDRREEQRTASARVVEIVPTSDGPVTVGQLLQGLMGIVNGSPEVWNLPVSFQTHCCVMELSGEEPEVVEPTLPDQRRYLLLTLEDA